MKRLAWLSMCALAAACGDDDGGGGGGTNDAGAGDGGVVVSDGGLLTEAARACTTQQSTQQGKVACAANALLATLTDAQKTSVNLQLSDHVNRSKWSNFPVMMSPRAGVQLSALSTASQSATLDLMTISLSNLGQTTATGILRADDFLKDNGGGSGYGSLLYSVAVYGVPGPSTDFEVMFGGHHMAYNLNFVDGVLYPVPQHLGAEPKGAFTYGAASYDPMTSKGDAMFAVYDALSVEQRSTARLAGTYNDTLAAPSLDYGKGDTRTTATVYPTGTNRTGIRVSDLSTDQQALVTKAIEQWVRQYPSESVDALMTAYAGAYADTLFGWAGDASGPSKDVERSYLRIDGPRVWIEVAVQAGVVIRGQTHYHTIYRDKTMDYGGQL